MSGYLPSDIKQVTICKFVMSLYKQSVEFFEKYKGEDGSVYDAINQLSVDANKLRRKHEGKLSGSEALTAAITESYPKNLHNRITATESNDRYRRRYIREALCEVDDVWVRRSVYESLRYSYRERHLLFKYYHKLSDGQKSRVRVLTKLIWNNLFREEK